MIEGLPLVIVCFLRSMWRSIRLRTFVSGHEFVEANSEGQPRHVQVLSCVTCGVTSMAWTRCGKCGRDA